MFGKMSIRHGLEEELVSRLIVRIPLIRTFHHFSFFFLLLFNPRPRTGMEKRNIGATRCCTKIRRSHAEGRTDDPRAAERSCNETYVSTLSFHDRSARFSRSRNERNANLAWRQCHDSFPDRPAAAELWHVPRFSSTGCGRARRYEIL